MFRFVVYFNCKNDKINNKSDIYIYLMSFKFAAFMLLILGQIKLKIFNSPHRMRDSVLKNQTFYECTLITVPQSPPAPEQHFPRGVALKWGGCCLSPSIKVSINAIFTGTRRTIWRELIDYDVGNNWWVTDSMRLLVSLYMPDRVPLQGGNYICWVATCGGNLG